MTRLLVPEMFGVMAIATVVHVVVSLLSDIGLRQAIIQSPRGESPLLLNTAFSLQAVRGVLIWGVCLAVAASLLAGDAFGLMPHASVYAASDLPAVLVVTSFSAVIMGFQSTKHMTTNRHLDLKLSTFIEVIAQVAGLAVMAYLGWVTRSIWSFVAGGLVTSVVTVVLSHTWLPGMTNRFQWDQASAKELIGFGRWVLLSSVLWVLAANADRLLLGAWASAATLGLYVLALNLATMVEGAGSRLFASVAMAALSEVARNEPDRFRSVYYRMRLPFDIGFIASAGFLFACGQPIVNLFYDQRYEAAGPMLQVLSFGLLFARYGLSGSAYVALGVPQNMMWIHFVKLVSVFLAVPLGYHLFGLTGALVGIAFHLLPTLPLMYWLNRKHRLNDWKFELAVLLAWPVGYAGGEAVSWLLALVEQVRTL